MTDIQGYEGLYAITEDGDVWSYPKQQGNRWGKGLWLKTQDKRGYHGVTLRKNDQPNHYLTHRLVAQTFIPNPQNKETVNHINGIKTDNNVQNLEWNTVTENQAHADATGLNTVIGTDNGNYSPWWYSYNGEFHEMDTPIKWWCRENNASEGVVHTLISEKRSAYSGRLVGYRFGKMEELK